MYPAIALSEMKLSVNESSWFGKNLLLFRFCLDLNGQKVFQYLIA